MPDIKSRLLAEKQQLDEAISKVEEYRNSQAFTEISQFQMSLLNIQSQAMVTYKECLIERIAWLEK